MVKQKGKAVGFAFFYIRKEPVKCLLDHDTDAKAKVVGSNAIQTYGIVIHLDRAKVDLIA